VIASAVDKAEGFGGEDGADNVEDLWFEVGQEQGDVARQQGHQLADWLMWAQMLTATGTNLRTRSRVNSLGGD
jgi:hypothetical protein